MYEPQFLIFASGNHGASYHMGLFDDKTEKMYKNIKKKIQKNGVAIVAQGVMNFASIHEDAG